MQKQIVYRSAVFAFFFILASAPAFAQSAHNLLKVQASFEFQIGDKGFPAGEYTVKRDLHSPQFLTLESADSKTIVMVQPLIIEQFRQPARTELIFKEYGSKRFLSEIRIRGGGVKYLLRRSKAERSLARSMEARTIHAIMSEI